METQTLNVVITKRQHQNQFFEEVLSEGVALRMMQIPAGRFLMGSPPEELDRFNDEGPQHPVQVEAFFMGKYPVTQAQWRFVAGLAQCDRPIESNSSRFKGDNRPVENVSWHDATEFCARLSQHSGRSYRLPTEAEWEYACRAGTTTPFHFGETIATELANYRGTDDNSFNWSGSYGRGAKGDYRQETTPVDHFGIANAFGLCDMHGNVWEWCQDHWHSTYQEAPVDGSAWLDPNAKENANRVRRGGSWSDYPRDSRSAARSYFGAGIRYSGGGFRVVCVAPRT